MDEWQCVPDIWGTAARKFGDRIALTDPHHFPFTTMTYSQVIFSFPLHWIFFLTLNALFGKAFCLLVMKTIPDPSNGILLIGVVILGTRNASNV